MARGPRGQRSVPARCSVKERCGAREETQARCADAHHGAPLLGGFHAQRACSLPQKHGVNLESIDFMVCNSGADTWHRADNGEWDADEGYQCEGALIEMGDRGATS